MNKTTAIVITLLFCGCSQKWKPPIEDTWVGSRSDGFPKWTLASEIPVELRVEPRDPNANAATRAADGDSHADELHCHLRMAALVIPSHCYKAAHGDATYFVNRFQEHVRSSKAGEFTTCGDESHQIKVKAHIRLRSYQDGKVMFQNHVVDQSEWWGYGDVIAMKPLKIDDDTCTVLFAMQGVDSWTLADQPTPDWHATATARLGLGQSHSQWAKVKAGENHVLTIVQLEQLTKGEKWPRQAQSNQLMSENVSCSVGPADRRSNSRCEYSRTQL